MDHLDVSEERFVGRPPGRIEPVWDAVGALNAAVGLVEPGQAAYGRVF